MRPVLIGGLRPCQPGGSPTHSAARADGIDRRVEHPMWKNRNVELGLGLAETKSRSKRMQVKGWPYMLSKYVLSADMLPMEMLSVDLLPVDMFSVDLLSVDILSVDMLSVDMLSVDLLPVDMLPVDMLPVDMLPVDVLPVDMLWVYCDAELRAVVTIVVI